MLPSRVYITSSEVICGHVEGIAKVWQAVQANVTLPANADPNAALASIENLLHPSALYRLDQA
jgi:hypothetical protein